MAQRPRQKYTKEWREQAVQRVIDQALAIPEAATRLSMLAKTLSNGIDKACHGQLGEIDRGRRPASDLEAESSRLKRELAEARRERDVLKKPPRTVPRCRCTVTRS